MYAYLYVYTYRTPIMMWKYSWPADTVWTKLGFWTSFLCIYGCQISCTESFSRDRCSNSCVDLESLSFLHSLLPLSKGFHSSLSGLSLYHLGQGFFGSEFLPWGSQPCSSISDPSQKAEAWFSGWYVIRQKKNILIFYYFLFYFMCMM